MVEATEQRELLAWRFSAQDRATVKALRRQLGITRRGAHKLADVRRNVETTPG